MARLAELWARWKPAEMDLRRSLLTVQEDPDHPIDWRLRTCADVCVSCHSLPADKLAEFLRLLYVAITECAPSVLNELILGSPCPFEFCRFCDEGDRKGAILLWDYTGFVLCQMRIVTRAIFEWTIADASAEFEALCAEMRKKPWVAGPPPTTPVRCELPRLRLYLRLPEPYHKQQIQHSGLLTNFIAAATKNADPLGSLEIDEIQILGDLDAPPVMWWWNFCRQLVESGLPVIIGEPLIFGEPSRHPTWNGSLMWLVGKKGLSPCTMSQSRLLSIEFVDTFVPGGNGCWLQLCEMLCLPIVRRHLKSLILTRISPIEFDEHDPMWEAMSRVLFCPNGPMRLDRLTLRMPMAYAALARHRDRMSADQGQQQFTSNVQVKWLAVDGGVRTDAFDHFMELFGATLERFEMTNFRVWWRNPMTAEMLMRMLAECPRLTCVDVKLALDTTSKNLFALTTTRHLQLTKLEYLTIDLCNPKEDDEAACAVVVSLVRLVGRQLDGLRLTVRGFAWPIRECVACAIVETCPKLRSLELTAVTESFFQQLVDGYERATSSFRVTTLKLGSVDCVASYTSPLAVALKNPLNGISRCLRRFWVTNELGHRMDLGVLKLAADSLREIHLANKTIMQIKTIGWGVRFDKSTLPMVSVCRPVRRRVAFLSSLRALPLEVQLPRAMVEEIFEFAGSRRVTRRLDQSEHPFFHASFRANYLSNVEVVGRLWPFDVILQGCHGFVVVKPHHV